jgi:hypothetical protein
MAIRFSCEHCGHPIEVDDHFEGRHGHCKHCGQSTVVPAHATAAPTHVAAEPAIPMRLRPLETDATAANGTAAPGLHAIPTGAPASPYGLLGEERSIGHAGPPATHGHPLVRLELKALRTLRNWLYVASVLCLAVAAYGFFLQNRRALHWGIVTVVATNVGMLVVGLAYLVTLPFKEGLHYGLLNLLVPGYAIYYWITRWPKMKVPVRNTAGSFLPIVLVLLAYFAYEEAPVVEREIEQLEKSPAVEKTIERAEKASSALAPGDADADPKAPGGGP